MLSPQDAFTPDEQRALAPYFTNTDRPVFALIRDLHSRLNSTVVIVTHDLTVAQSCDRTIALRDGRVEEDVRR